MVFVLLFIFVEDYWKFFSLEKEVRMHSRSKPQASETGLVGKQLLRVS